MASEVFPVPAGPNNSRFCRVPSVIYSWTLSLTVLSPIKLSRSWGRYFSTKRFKYKTGYKSEVAKKSEVNKFLNFIIQGLDKKGFLQPDHKRQSMIRNINNIFHRLNLSQQEIRILLGIFSTLNQINKKTWIDKVVPLFINLKYKIWQKD